MNIHNLIFLILITLSGTLHAELQQSLNESITKIDDEIKKIESYSETRKLLTDEIAANKVKFSDILISVTSNNISKEDLNEARKSLKTVLENFNNRKSELNKIIESSDNFYEANQKAQISFNEIYKQTPKKDWRIKQLLNKHQSKSEEFNNSLKDLLIFRQELTDFIVQLNDWTQNLKKNVKANTFRWEKEKVLFSATVLSNIITEVTDIQTAFRDLISDYNIAEPNNQKSFDIFLLVTSLIIFCFVLMSVFVIHPLKGRTYNINKTNLIEIALLNSVLKYRWFFTVSLFLSLIVLTYIFSFDAYPAMIYTAVLSVLIAYTMWKIGRLFTKTVFLGEHGQLQFISDRERKKTASRFNAAYTALCLVLMLKIPKVMYGISGDLFHTIYFISFLIFIFLCIGAFWRTNIKAILVNKSKRVKFFARVTRVLFLFILFLIFCSLVLEASGFITLSETVQMIFLYNFTTVIAAWMLYAIGSEFINVSFIRSVEKSKIPFQESVAIRNFSNLFLNSALFIFTIMLVVKAWTSYIFIIPSLMDLSILSVGGHVVQIHHVLKIIAAYFVVRFIYILAVYWWDVFIFDYLDIDRKFEANFYALTKYSLILIFMLLCGSILGFTYRNLAIIAGALGVGIGFGLQNIANNFISGIILLFERPIRVGDVLEIDGDFVIVKHIGSRSTIVNTLNNSSIVIPNSHIISNNLINWTLSDNIIGLWVEVGVQYGTDTGKVTDIIAKVLDKNPQILKTPVPNILFSQFADSSLVFRVRFWIDNPLEYLNIKSTVMHEINRSFAKNGIVIPFPQRDVHIKSET
ncbi:MAG: mechanosensitive ion channel [Oligoflexia bacterium]|nr:mechanosensitive ion channel [Oligoflexia bacterium]